MGETKKNTNECIKVLETVKLALAHINIKNIYNNSR